MLSLMLVLKLIPRMILITSTYDNEYVDHVDGF